jgi:hypothetical protein
MKPHKAINLAIVFIASVALYPNMLSMTEQTKIMGTFPLQVSQYLLAQLFFGCAGATLLQLGDILISEHKKKRGPQP